MLCTDTFWFYRRASISHVWPHAATSTLRICRGMYCTGTVQYIHTSCIWDFFMRSDATFTISYSKTVFYHLYSTEIWNQWKIDGYNNVRPKVIVRTKVLECRIYVLSEDNLNLQVQSMYTLYELVQYSTSYRYDIVSTHNPNTADEVDPREARFAKDQELRLLANDPIVCTLS